MAEKEFDWKCKDCGRDIPKGEGHDKEKCLKCTANIDDILGADEQDIEHAEMEIKAKKKKTKNET